MDNINQDITRMIVEMRELGKLPAPCKGGNYNNLLRYNKMRDRILDKFLSAFNGGYRLEMPITHQPSNEPLTDTWISAEERLPKEHKPVLCVMNGKPRENIILEDAYQLGSWNRADGWIIDEWLEWENANVSWWCELPELPERRPPEGEEET